MENIMKYSTTELKGKNSLKRIKSNVVTTCLEGRNHRNIELDAGIEINRMELKDQIMNKMARERRRAHGT